ncbi:hypothetical protein E4U58_001038, partial [Claviceps cyperi]
WARPMTAWYFSNHVVGMAGPYRSARSPVLFLLHQLGFFMRFHSPLLKPLNVQKQPTSVLLKSASVQPRLDTFNDDYRFRDPEAVRLYVAQLEDRQASLLRMIEEGDERDRKRWRLHNVEVTSLREEREKAAQKMNEVNQKMDEVGQENQGLNLVSERSSLLKSMKVSDKTFRTKLASRTTLIYEQQGPL